MCNCRLQVVHEILFIGRETLVRNKEAELHYINPMIPNLPSSLIDRHLIAKFPSFCCLHQKLTAFKNSLSIYPASLRLVLQKYSGKTVESFRNSSSFGMTMNLSLDMSRPPMLHLFVWCIALNEGRPMYAEFLSSPVVPKAF